MKKPFAIITMLLLVLSVAGCAEKPAPIPPAPEREQADGVADDAAKEQNVVFPDANTENKSMSATMRSTVIPTDLQDMEDKASNVVLCTVTDDSESETFESGLVLSYAGVTVEKVIKGALSEGDVLNITETGTRFEDHDASIDGVPLLRKGMRVVLFLHDKTEQGRYGIVANYYGKLFVDGDGLVYPPSYFSARAGTISGFTEPMPLDKLLQSD